MIEPPQLHIFLFKTLYFLHQLLLYNFLFGNICFKLPSEPYHLFLLLREFAVWWYYIWTQIWNMCNFIMINLFGCVVLRIIIINPLRLRVFGRRKIKSLWGHARSETSVAVVGKSVLAGLRLLVGFVLEEPLRNTYFWFGKWTGKRWHWRSLSSGYWLTRSLVRSGRR